MWLCIKVIKSNSKHSRKQGKHKLRLSTQSYSKLSVTCKFFLHWLIINGFIRLKSNTLIGSIWANLQTLTCVSNHVHILGSSCGFNTGLSHCSGLSLHSCILLLFERTLHKKKQKSVSCYTIITAAYNM